MRLGLIIAFRTALVISAASLVYLLFVFGHTDLTPHARVLEVAIVAGLSALVAGILQWVGLPAAPPKAANSARGRKRTAK